MKSTLRILLLSAAFTAPSLAFAQSATQADAKAIEAKLLSLVAKGVADTGALSVKAAGDRYEVLFDLRKAIEKNIAPWTLKEANSILHTVRSAGAGLWDYSGQGPIRYATDVAAANQSSSVTLNVGNFENKGTFDESIRFIRNGEFKLGDLLYSSRSAQNSLRLEVKDYALKLALNEKKPGLGDITTESTAHDMTETFGAFPNPETKLSGAAMSGRYVFEDVDFKGISRLVDFWNGSAKGKKLGALSDAERVALSEIIGQHAPFIKRFGENTSVDGVALTSAGNAVKIENVSYQWAVEDIGGDAAVVLGAKAKNITFDAQALPPELKKALPREAGVGLRYSGFKFSAMWQALADPKLAHEALGADDFYTRRILPDGKVLASFDNTYIRSDYYDITLSGDMQVLLSNPGKPEKADLKLVARDFDKTIKFLQDLSTENPQLSKVSFTAMMMKGFGKVQGDGSMLWHFQTNASGQVTVNGQPLPMK